MGMTIDPGRLCIFMLSELRIHRPTGSFPKTFIYDEET